MGEDKSHLGWLRKKVRKKVTKGFLPSADNWDQFEKKMIGFRADWKALDLMAEGEEKPPQYYILPFRDKHEFGVPGSGKGIRIGPMTGYLADRPGIYMIAIHGGETYVGESRNLEQRMDSHWREKPNELREASEFAGLIIIKNTGTRGEDMMRSDAFRCTMERVLKSVLRHLLLNVHKGERVDKWVWPSDAEIDEIEKLSIEIMKLLEAYRSKGVPNLLSNFMEFSGLDKSPIPDDFLSLVK